MTSFPTNPFLSAEMLARREALPVKPAPVTLEGRWVRLVPLDLDRDSEALHAVSNGQPIEVGDRRVDAYDADAMIWRYLFDGPFEDATALRRFLAWIVETPNLLPFCVFDVASDRQVGMTTYVANFPEHLKVELGHIWFSPVVQRTNANMESAYLLLRHAYDLGYRRLEWKCDALNERSRRSALRIGFKFEGIQEAHYVIKGRNRDTAWFRILDHEWPEVRATLESKLYG